jgi:hypothetical protein
MVHVLQDPFCMLTRQFNSPDLDRLVPESALFLGLQMHHPTFWTVIPLIGSFRVDWRGHRSELCEEVSSVVEKRDVCIVERLQQWLENSK